MALLLLVLVSLSRAGAGDFLPPVPPSPLPSSPLSSSPPPASPLSFGDFSANDAIFSAFGKGSPELLSVSLAAETTVIAPGTPFRVVLTLNHLNGGYTYFTNPGGVGVGTTVRWTLPDGFAVSEPEWPAPELYTNGGMNFYVHRGAANVVFVVTPPAALRPGEKVALAGEIDTQVCTASSCNPLRLPVSVDVIVAARPGNPSPAVLGAIAALPEKPEEWGRDWRFTAVDYGGGLVIGMYPESAKAKPSDHDFSDSSLSDSSSPDAYFFDSGAVPFVDSQLPQTLESAGGAHWLRLPRLPGAARPGEKLSGILRVGGDAFRIALPVAAEGDGLPPALQPAVARQGWAILAFAFLGGLLLNVMPCVFPVIGLKIMSFAKQAHTDRRSVFLHGLAYTAGVLLCFWALALAVITMGRGWGAQLQADWFLFALCHIFLIMSMNMAGVFDVGASVAVAGRQGLGGRTGLKRSFFTGLLATLTSTPCSAPFLGTALAYALSLPPVTSLGVFTLMALGFAFPYLALSLFPGWLKRLPKPGAWMDTFRQAMCFPLFGTTAYLFWTMEAMMEEWRFLLFLFGLVLTAMACWLYGKFQKSRVRRPGLSRWLAGFAVLALAGGVWLGLPKSGADLQWREWSPDLVARLRREGVPVYIDFTARWCATCQLNKRVYSDEGLRALLEEKNVALLKADWTLYDERITSTLRSEFNKAAVPVTVLYPPGSARGEVLPDILTVGDVAGALRRLP